jgi:hypothetical protein
LRVDHETLALVNREPLNFNLNPAIDPNLNLHSLANRKSKITNPKSRDAPRAQNQSIPADLCALGLLHGESVYCAAYFCRSSATFNT